MKQSELKKFIQSGIVHGVTLFRGVGSDAWEVWVSGANNDDSALRVYGLCLETERGGHKEYTSLDRAFAALRGLGWKSSVTVQDNNEKRWL